VGSKFGADSQLGAREAAQSKMGAVQAVCARSSTLRRARGACVGSLRTEEGKLETKTQIGPLAVVPQEAVSCPISGPVTDLCAEKLVGVAGFAEAPAIH
jgi:hypothetical protein